jgi:hypothetical protein
MLGRFADEWWDNYSIADLIGPFHLQARDAVATGDRETARRFYRERVMIDDPVIAALTQHHLVVRIETPRQLLGALD